MFRRLEICYNKYYNKCVFNLNRSGYSINYSGSQIAVSCNGRNFEKRYYTIEYSALQIHSHKPSNLCMFPKIFKVTDKISL